MMNQKLQEIKNGPKAEQKLQEALESLREAYATEKTNRATLNQYLRKGGLPLLDTIDDAKLQTLSLQNEQKNPDPMLCVFSNTGTSEQFTQPT